MAIDERFSLKTEIQVKEKAHQSEWAKLRLENLEIRELAEKRDREMLTVVRELVERVRRLETQESASSSQRQPVSQPVRTS